MTPSPAANGEQVWTEAHVAAVVLAYNGAETLRRVLDCLRAQTASPRQIIVVDNGSTDETPALCATPENAALITKLIRLPHNEGVGAGHTEGWRAALADPECTLVWALEHDSFASADCLRELLAAGNELSKQDPKLGVLASLGARNDEELRSRQARRPDPFPGNRFTFNCVLFTRRTIEASGFPRADFFVGQEDWEYSKRTAETVTRWWIPAATHLHPTMGGRRLGRPTSVLRSYYSTRNGVYLRSREHPRVPAVLRTIGWGAASLVKIVFRDDHKLRRVRARTRGVVDGLFGRLGERSYGFLRDSR